MKYFVTYICLTLSFFCSAQDYFEVDRYRAVEIKETYDGGYLLLSDESAGNEPSHLTKLNLKGDILWEIVIEDGVFLLSTSLQTDSQNNIYISGNSGRHDTTYGNSFTLKLSPCGELVWIHFHGYKDYWDIVTDIDISEDQYLYSIYNQLYGIQDEPGGLVVNPGKLRYAKMNLDGDTLWSGVFPVATGAAEHNSMIITSDGGQLISIEDYFSYEGSPNYIRPTFMKVNALGEVDWIQRIGVEEGILGDGQAAIELEDGNFICLFIQRFIGVTNYFPLFYAKLSPNGEVLDIHQISEEGWTYNGGKFMLQQSVNSFIIATVASYPDNLGATHFELYKIDSSGNILESYVGEEEYLQVKRFDICENGDILIAHQKSSSDQPNNTHIYRFDGETLLPIPVPEEDNNEYDTLCPEGIAMSEYSFPTSEELGQSQISISDRIAFQLFPNPIIDNLSLRWSSIDNTEQKWMIECVDISGKIVYQHKISNTIRALDINTTKWDAGVYILTIKNKHTVLYNYKIVK